MSALSGAGAGASCRWTRELVGERLKLENRVPVAPRAASAELFLDERAGELRAPDAVRVDDVGVPADRAKDLAADDGLLQRGDVGAVGRLPAKPDEEKTRVLLR